MRWDIKKENPQRCHGLSKFMVLFGPEEWTTLPKLEKESSFLGRVVHSFLGKGGPFSHPPVRYCDSVSRDCGEDQFYGTATRGCEEIAAVHGGGVSR
jgi:hypothetical protein